MELERSQCYELIRRRDRRYDGLFFTGVKTTGIYCRSICPARTPKLENVIFLKSAAQAQIQGFRPCKRCRPDQAPEMFVGHTLLRQAMDRMADGELRVAELAAQLKVSDRHLRRLFREHLGASPREVARSQRLSKARRLLEETHLPMPEVAFASGFSSLRQFNQVFRQIYQRPPSELRHRGTSAGSWKLRLSYRPPFDWESLCEFMRPRATAGLERVEGGVYERLFGSTKIRVQELDGFLEVQVDGGSATQVNEIARRLRRLFDLDLDPETVMSALGSEAELRPYLQGLRLPGAWDPFETTIRAILGQQVSVKAATTVCGRLVAALGQPGHFPTPEALAEASLETMGLTSRRAQTVREVATRVASGELVLGPGFDEQALLSVRGIGPWTTAYLSMRVGGRPNAFPAGDLVLKKVTGLSERELEKRSKRWEPWRAYAAMALWKGAVQ